MLDFMNITRGPNRTNGGIALKNTNLCLRIVYHNSKIGFNFSKRLVSWFDSCANSTKRVVISG